MSKQISHRLPDDLFESVEEFANDWFIDRAAAINQLLRDGLRSQKGSTLVDRLEAIEQRISVLENRRIPLVPQKQRSRDTDASQWEENRDTNASQQQPERDTLVSQSGQGITQMELCQLFGWSGSNIAPRAKREGYSNAVDFLEDKTGWRKYPRDSPKGRWYEPTKEAPTGE